MSQQNELTNLLQVLTKETYLGRTYFLVWRDLRKALAEKEKARNVAPTFWGLTVFAHLWAALWYMLRLSDKHRDAESVFTLLEQAEQNPNLFKESTPQEVKATIKKARCTLDYYDETIKRLRSIRNKVLAHLDRRAVKDRSQFELLDANTITKMKKLYDAIAEIINDISAALDGSTSWMELIAWDEFDHLLRLVEKGRDKWVDEIKAR